MNILKKIPTRTCIGCGEQKPKNELIRTLTSDPRVKNATVTSAKMSYTSMFLTADITPIGSDKTFNLYLYQSENGEISIR